MLEMNFEIGGILPTEEASGFDEFLPTESDLDAVEKAFANAKSASSNTAVSSDVSPQLTTVGIESEFPNKRKVRANVRETGTDSMKHYIKSMCNHELLNKNEEIILAREIQILLKWEAQREKLEEQLLR